MKWKIIMCLDSGLDETTWRRIGGSAVLELVQVDNFTETDTQRAQIDAKHKVYLLRVCDTRYIFLLRKFLAKDVTMVDL